MNTPFCLIKPVKLFWQQGFPYEVDGQQANWALPTSATHGINFDHLLSNALAADSAFSIIADTKFAAAIHFLSSGSYWLKHAPVNRCLHYISCDNAPVSRADLTRILALWPECTLSSQLLAHYPILTPGFHRLSLANGRVMLTLMLGDLTDCFSQLLVCGDALLESQVRGWEIDAWHVNARSLSYLTEQNNTNLFQAMALLSKPGATLIGANTTLWHQRLLQVGFSSTTEGYVFKQPTQSANKRKTPWHSPALQKNVSQEAIVIGAGLAGCFMAYALAKRGWKVRLVEAKNSIASGASAITQGLLYPTFSAFDSPLTAFMLAAYLYALHFYNTLSILAIAQLSGLLQLAYDDKTKHMHQSLRAWLTHYPALAQLVSAQHASELAGISLAEGGIFLPQAGHLNGPALCDYLTQHPGITPILAEPIDSLNFVAGRWTLGHLQSQVVILATSVNITQFSQAAYLPLQAIAGQVTMIAANAASNHLKLPLCAKGHVLPSCHGQHSIGATYQSNSTHCEVEREANNMANLAKLAQLPTRIPWSNQVVNSWSASRATTPDYLPLVGALPDKQAFQQVFQTLTVDKKRWQPEASPCYRGLYVCTGFGSRGMTTIPLSTEWLASSLNNEPPLLPHRLIQALSPARFLVKKMAKGLQ